MMIRSLAAGAALLVGMTVLVGCGNEGEGVDPASVVPTTTEVYNRSGVDTDTGVAISVTKEGVATLSMTQNRPALRRVLSGKSVTLACERTGAAPVQTTFTWPKQFSSTQATLKLRSVKAVTGCTITDATGAPVARVAFVA